MGCKVIFLITLHDLTDWISEEIATLRKKKPTFNLDLIILMVLCVL